MSIPNTPIVNSGALYVNGLEFEVFAFFLLFIHEGAARDSTNTNDIILNNTLVLNGQNIGPNGTDNAPITPNTRYAVHVIADSNKNNPTAGLLSMSASNPNLPNGYDMFRRVGWIYTDSSANFKKQFVYGYGQERTYWYETPFLVLTAGNSATYAALAPTIPPIDTIAKFQLNLAAGTGAGVDFIPFGASTSAAYSVAETSINTLIDLPTRVDISDGFTKLYYKVNGTAVVTSLYVVGFVDYLNIPDSADSSPS